MASIINSNLLLAAFSYSLVTAASTMAPETLENLPRGSLRRPPLPLCKNPIRCHANCKCDHRKIGGIVGGAVCAAAILARKQTSTSVRLKHHFSPRLLIKYLRILRSSVGEEVKGIPTKRYRPPHSFKSPRILESPTDAVDFPNHNRTYQLINGTHTPWSLARRFFYKVT